MRKNKSHISIILFALLLGFLAKTSVCAVEDFSGDWQGQWVSDDEGSGGLSVYLTQSGASVGGMMTIRNTECGTFSNLPLTGNIAGNVISIYATAVCSEDGSKSSLAFTQGVLANNLLSGIYTVYTDGEFYDSGDFNLTRTINYINSSAGIGGSIIPVGKISVIAGSDTTFNILPDHGYQILDVKVDGVSVGVNNSYTFYDVSANHTITATFKTAPSTTGSIVPNILMPLLLVGD
jgi:hypothetical protein